MIEIAASLYAGGVYVYMCVHRVVNSGGHVLSARKHSIPVFVARG